jgi:hypothetical protein
MQDAPVSSTAEGLPPARCLDDLLTEFLDNQRTQNQCRLSVNAIEAQLPEWVKPGPMYLYHDGTIGGPEVGWPQVAEMPEPPEHPSAFRKIRKGLRDTWQDSTHAAFCPSKDDRRPMSIQLRRKARLRGFAAVRKVIARIRERNAVREASGVNAVYCRWDDLSDASIELQDEMLDRYSKGTSAEAMAVTLVLEIIMDCNTRDPLDEQGGRTGLAVELLERFAADLTGVLRIVVDDLLGDGHRVYSDLLIGGGWPLDGCYSPGDEDLVDASARQLVEAV